MGGVVGSCIHLGTVEGGVEPVARVDWKGGGGAITFRTGGRELVIAAVDIPPAVD